MEKWEGKLAVVTGASSGIGAAIVKDLAIAGINVVGLARRVEKIEKIITELKEVTGKVYSHKCDVSDEVSVKSAFKWIEDTFGSIHILVNNAGIERLETMTLNSLIFCLLPFLNSEMFKFLMKEMKLGIN